MEMYGYFTLKHFLLKNKKFVLLFFINYNLSLSLSIYTFLNRNLAIFI